MQEHREKHNHKIHIIYPGKPSWGIKPNKNFLNIDSQYNAKTINQNTREYPTMRNAPLSSFFQQLEIATSFKLAH
jgi:hypothetical protein